MTEPAPPSSTVRPPTRTATVLALVGLLVSLPALAMGWIIAGGVLAYGLPTPEAQGQMALPFAREFSIWGLAEAAGGSIALLIGLMEWLAGRRTSAAWWLWTPALLALVGLLALFCFALLSVSFRSGHA